MNRTYEYYDSAIYDITDTAIYEQDEDCSIGFVLRRVGRIDGSQDRYLGVFFGDGESTYAESHFDTWEEAYDFVIRTYEDTIEV